MNQEINDRSAQTEKIMTHKTMVEILHNYLPKDLVNIVEEYHNVTCFYGRWCYKKCVIDEEGNYWCRGGCRKWFRCDRTRARTKAKLT